MSFFSYFSFIDRFGHSRTLKANKQARHTTNLTILASFILIFFFFYYFPLSVWEYAFNRRYNLNVSETELDLTQVYDLKAENLQIATITQQIFPLEGNKIGIKPMKWLGDKDIRTNEFILENDNLTLDSYKTGVLAKCDTVQNKSDFDLFKLNLPEMEVYPEYYECAEIHQNGGVGDIFLVNKRETQTTITAEYEMMSGISPESGKLQCFNSPSSAFFGFFYKSYVPDFDNQDNPIRSYIVTKSFDLLGFNELNLILHLKKTVVLTDTNYLFNFAPEHKHEFYTLNRISEQRSGKVSNPAKPEDCKLNVTINFEFEDNVTVVKRKYEQFDRFIANSTGLLKFIAMCLVFGLNFFEKDVFNDYLVKSLYIKKSLESSELKIQLKEPGLKTKVSQTNRQDLESRDKDSKKWFRSCCSKKKDHLAAKARVYFEYDSDLLTIIKKTLMFESLLKMLMTEDQVKLLNCLDVRPIQTNVEEKVAEIEELFPLAANLPNLEEIQSGQIRGDELLTAKILEEINKN